MMKNVFSPVVIVFCLLTLVACGSNKVEGKGPEDIPVEWVNAHVQKDQEKMTALLDKEQSLLDSKKSSENDLEIKDYKLTEWKVNDDNYFYEIVYTDPESEEVKTDRMKIIKTEDGWKRAKYGQVKDFEKLTADLKVKTVKEMH